MKKIATTGYNPDLANGLNAMVKLLTNADDAQRRYVVARILPMAEVPVRALLVTAIGRCAVGT
jgi:hypothetical protein